jgi:uncharacterized membrane protein
MEHFLANLWNYTLVFFSSMVPLLDVKFSITFGTLRGLPWFPNLLTAYLGSLVPMPFIILFIRKILAWMKTIKIFRPIAEFVDRYATKKSRRINPKFIQLGIFVFTAIPLPGFGVWSGSLLAAVLDLRIKQSILPIALGHAIASMAIALVTGLFR